MRPGRHLRLPGIKRSSVITRVCYDAAKYCLIVGLKGALYRYRAVDKATIDEFLSAESMGKFYNSNIKVSGNGGEFDCRTHPVPAY